MFKVIKFELRKLVSRPGIYILAILLGLLLVVSAFVYEPKQTTQTYNTLSGNTISEIDADFKNNYKEGYDNIVSSTLAVATSIKSTPAQSYRNEIGLLVDTLCDDLENFVDVSVGLTNDKLDSLKNVHNEENTGSLDLLYEKITSLLGKENSAMPVAITQQNYLAIDKLLTDIKSDFDRVLKLSSPNNDDFRLLANQCSGFKNNVLNSVKNIKYIDYSAMIDSFVVGGNYYKVTVERHNVIERKMQNIVDRVATNNRLEESKSLKKDFNDLFNEYRLVSENYSNLFKAKKDLTVANSFSESDMSNIKFLKVESKYSLKETVTKYNYYIQKDSNELSYANALSFDYSSNSKTNGFDYTYFAMSIFSVVLIVFAVMLASYSVAGERKDGTMRFVSIRPVSRTSLYWGKFFFIASISLVMLIFSTVASLIVGASIFGMNTLNTLTIINATQVIVLHPSLAIVIFVASIFLQLMIYVSIAMMLSSFLKSDLLALILSAGLYVINLLLPLFFDSNSWLRFNPFACTSLYAYVGAGTIQADTILGKIFSAVVYHGSNIWVGLILITLIVGITNMIGIFATKKREF